MIDLEKLERLHKEATPAPWYCTRTIQEELGMKPFDWGTIMLKPREGKSYAPILAKMNMNFASEEEQQAERKRYYSSEGEKEHRDPGQPGRDAELIAAVRNALPELIAENKALRQRVAEYSSELAVLLGVKHDFEKRVRELERQRGFFLNALKENYLCPYSCCKCDVGSDVEEWDCTAADNRGCWIEAAEEAAKEAGE
ncbi:MAG: hypothetical protein IJB53_00290 [Mailhella sp.]|nr:hypothetical protein [Mailhella sp.]